LSQLHQQLVSGRVAEAVVDDLKAVQIQEQQREGMVPVALGHSIEAQQIVQKERTIG
jgi:hypothetical protein